VDNNLQVQDNGSYDDAYIHEGCDTGRDVNIHYSWAVHHMPTCPRGIAVMKDLLDQ